MTYFTKNRISRIEKEITFLENLNFKLLIKHIAVGILSIPVFIVFAYHIIQKIYAGESSNSLFILFSIGIGLWIWWLARYSDLAFFVLMFPVAFLILGIMIISWFSESSGLDLPIDSLPNRKSGRQAKLDRAISRRKERLVRLRAQLEAEGHSA